MPSRHLTFSRRAVLHLSLLACGAGAIGISGTQAQGIDYRKPNAAPPSWMQFASLVKFRFEEWVASDDSISARFRTYLKIHTGMSDGPPATLTVRAWINPDGSVERVSFTAFKDEGATRDLRTILTRGNIGEAPPPEMLQPVNLRFSLRAR